MNRSVALHVLTDTREDAFISAVLYRQNFYSYPKMRKANVKVLENTAVLY
jgi:hypothetical protein